MRESQVTLDSSSYLKYCGTGISPKENLPTISMGFPGGSDGKESSCNAGDMGLIPGSRRSPREGDGYPLQYSCLEKPTRLLCPWGHRVRHD